MTDSASAWARLALACALLAGLASASPAQMTTLLPFGSSWRYRDSGPDPDAIWTQPSFDDSGWASGRAIFGYGDSDITTTVDYGPDSSRKRITTYFRTEFQVGNPGAYREIHLNLIRDDGAVVYLNGQMVYRSNLPVGYTSSTTAINGVEGGSERLPYRVCLPPSRLVTGRNVLAVEIHQAYATSSDLGFDLQLEGSASITLWRSPYMQLLTPSSAVVRWNTGAPAPGWIRYGTSPTSLTMRQENTSLLTGHAFVLQGLSPATRYYYAVGYGSITLAGGDGDHSFQTAPVPGTNVATRLWVLGDVGAGTDTARSVRDAFLRFTGSRKEDMLLLLGDNAYPDGDDSEFQVGLFDPFGGLMDAVVTWPTLGNHDARSASSSQQSGPYYDVFTLPRKGEAGGVPSGTEAYYSFDYGQIHVVCLDSDESSRSPTGPMLTWLAEDLAATTRRWKIAFWHHSPYSKGSHDSDTVTEMVQMREAALPILEQYGVDLVLTGHSHSYERTFFLDGHYGTSDTLDLDRMVKVRGNGRMDGDGPYIKRDGPHTGTVYVVVGSSSEIEDGPLNHPAMVTSLLEPGSVILDIADDRLDARFLTASGVVADYFTITKDNPAWRRSDALSALRSAAGLDALPSPDVARLDAEKAVTPGRLSILDAVAILRGP